METELHSLPCQHASGEREMGNRAAKKKKKKKKKRRRFDVRDPDFIADFKSTERGKKAGGVQVLVWRRKEKHARPFSK